MIIYEYLPVLLTVYAACLLAFASPGPNFVAITSYSVESRAAGYGAAIGISFGTAIWAFFAATGLTALLSTFQFATTIISIAGGMYLIWLGVNAFKSVFAGQQFIPSIIDTKNNISFAKSIIPGLAIQLTNPKTALFWLALTSIAIKPDTPIIIVAMLVAGCLILAIIWHCLLAFAFSTGTLREAYIKYKPVFSCVFGIVFIGYGLRVFYALLGIEY